MNATTTPKVGDAMILTKGYGGKPVTTNVDKVTPKGWLRLWVPANPGYFATFKADWRNEYTETGVAKHNAKWTAVAYSDEKSAELIAKHEERLAEKARKEAEVKAYEEARNNRLAEELAAVKAACGGNVYSRVRGRADEDGYSLVWLALPVKPELVERKGNAEHVWVKLVEVEETDYKASRMTGEEVKVKMVEAYLTYANKRNGSLPSCSSSKSATEEEALWNAARYCYHNGFW